MRKYSNVAIETTLVGGAGVSDTSIVVSSTQGFPSVDFILALSYDTADQELVLVTGVAGTTLTVTRGYDNTTPQIHDAGAAVRHVHAAIDFRDSRDHEAATAAHGATGAVVGTTNTQAFTNKDLSSATNIFPATLATDAEVTVAVTTGVGGHDAETAVHGVAEVVGTTNVQTLTNKDLTDPSNTFTAPTIQTFTAADTWTKPAGLKRARARVWGAGGRGGTTVSTGAGQGSEGGGGGAGGFCEKLWLAADLGATEPVGVGVGGSGGSATPSPGGESTFKTMTANGGGGGSSGAATATDTLTGSGAGGSANGGDLNAAGSDGMWGKVIGGKPVRLGNGGAAPQGGGSVRGSGGGSGGAGNPGQFPGGGGSGGCNEASQGTDKNGGAGANGLVIIEEFYV